MSLLMADWKEKGYVPDSDEEDDSQESVVRQPSTAFQETNHNRDQNIEKTPRKQDGGKDQENEADSGVVWNFRKETAALSTPKLKQTGINADEDLDDIRQHRYKASAKAQLQAELVAGIFPGNRSGWGATPGSSSRPAAWDTSGASSPLSEAPSSFPDLPTLFRPPDDGNHDDAEASATGSRIRSSSSSIALANETGHDSNKPRVTGRPGRTLRHRNAIQLHPYVIEKEKYNQSWRSRGLKPIHILQKEAARAQAQNEDSQNFELSEDDESLRSSPHARTTALSLSQSSLQDGTSGIVVEDDFPDVDTLLRSTSPGTVTYGHKRRKINPRFRNPPVVLPRRQGSPRLAQVIALPHDDGTLLDVPPSPPLSGSPKPHGRVYLAEPLFRAPPRLTSPSLPTPVTSSEPRKRQSRDKLKGGEDSDAGSPLRQRAHESSDEVGSPFEKEVGHQLEHAQRRIKGVLPASWLKLDLRTQTKKPLLHSRNLQSHSPEKTCDQRGVARPVIKKGSKSLSRLRSTQEVFVLSDDDSVGSEAPKVVYDISQNEHPSISRRGEAREDDSIDAMLPSVSRSRLNRKKPGSRQRKTTDSDVQKKSASTKRRRRPSIRQKDQTSVPAQFQNANGKRRVHPPHLSVLDAFGRNVTQSALLPSFLKIASRTARSRPDRGRHSPSRKYLRLATREDTKDVHETIHAWREGTVALLPMADTPKPREPLQPRSANDFTHIGSTSTPKQSETAIATGNLIQVRSQPARSRTIQSSLENLVRRGLSESRHLPDPYESLPHLHCQDNKGNKKGQLSLGLQMLADSRPAVLESSQTKQDQMHPQSALSRGLPIFSKSAYGHQNSRPVLDRYLLEDPLAALNREEFLNNTRRRDSSTQKPMTSAASRTRKRRPRRLDVAVLQSRKSTSPAIVDEISDNDGHLPVRRPQQAGHVQGLGPFGTRYTATFDVTPLSSGTRFHQSTYIGSGDFQKSLTVQASCDLDSPRGISAISCNHKTFQWGAWNEIVSTEVGEVFECIVQGAQNSAISGSELDAPIPMDAITLLAAVISYFSVHLSFSDPVDRLPFLQRCRGLLSAFWDGHSQSAAVTKDRSNNDAEMIQAGIRIAALGLVLTAQLHQVSEHFLVPLQVRDEIQVLIMTGAKKTLTALRTCLGEFEQYLIKSKRMGNVGHLIQVDQPAIEAFVIVHHVLRRAGIQSINVLDIVHPILTSASKENTINVGCSEAAWQGCFTLLPFLEFDEHGCLDVGRRFKDPRNHWNLVKQLIDPILDIYVGNPRGQAPSFNEYCRSLFARCLHLMDGWGWYQCDSIIGTLFDFFAKSSLAHLRYEESRGSPHFLDNLSQNPALNAEPEDRCFHLFLKIIGSGLKHLRHLYPSKKIRDLVWRLMPNHGRSHPKEQAIRQEDLDALRNHHDLLCTLYWASPVGFRPSLNAIQTLVDLDRSHREACHISIRAWFKLIQFQLSTDEPLESLVYFTQWHSDFLQRMLRQHGLARTEAEDQVRSAHFLNGLSVSKQVLESTIAKNQQQVEAVLDDALVCLELAVAAAQTREAAATLLSPALVGIFGLFDGSEKLANGVVIKALNVLLAYTKHCPGKRAQRGTQNGNDDSQDYGDWSIFNSEDGLDAEPIKQASIPLLQMTGPLRTLLSNCFGEDRTPQANLLTKLIDTWVAVSCVLIEDGVKSYDNYLGQFGNDAWHTLRDTEQTRKYEPCFLSTFIETDRRIFRHSRYSFLACWLGSLVERESQLKFQHKLTSALLNAETNDPLFANLPFWKGFSPARFDITLLDISECRLSLISCILSNMRTSLSMSELEPGADAAQLKQEYKDLLKHLMTTMKRNYAELGQGSNIKGAYVDFVHRVVELLQEHTSSICPVDRFFTDSTAFPLPAYDPNYVVGQLKNYGRRLSDPKTPKQLAVFLQSVSERAVADGHQAYLVEQLHEAMSNSSQNASVEPTLREFVIDAIVPGYIQMAFETSVGWVLAVPFLEALKKVFEGIHLGLNGCNVGAVDKVASSIMSFLESIRTAVTPLLGRSTFFESTTILKTLASCYVAIAALLPTLDYILRTKLQEVHGAAINCIAFFKSFSAYTHAIIVPTEKSIELDRIDAPRPLSKSTNSQFDEVYGFVIHELRNTLRNNWTRVGEEYFVIRGSSRWQVKVDSGQFEEERDALRLALHEFGDCLSALSGLGGWEEWREVARRLQKGMERDYQAF